MKVLLAHKLYGITGGAEIFFRETDRILRKNGHQTLLVSTGAENEAVLENVHLLKAPAYREGGIASKIVNLPAAIYDTGKKRTVTKLIRAFKPDVMHTFSINVHLSPSIVDAARAASVPLVGTFNDYKHICPNYKLFHSGRLCLDCQKGAYLNAFKNKCCHDSRGLSLASGLEAYVHKFLKIYQAYNHITFSSEYMAQVTQRFWPARTISWSKLRNPLPETFRVSPPAGPKKCQPYGLYFGRLAEEKGVDRILQAASEIDGFSIKIIGDGPELPRLKEMRAAANLSNVEFLGPLWGKPLAAYLSNALFVLVPSLWPENSPYVINQAFTAGCPVIASRRGGIPELVTHGKTGFLFDPDDVAELAKHIRALATDEAKASKMGNAALQFAKRQFGEEDFIDKLMTAYSRGIDAYHHHRQ